MMRSLTAVTALALLTACGDGQPFFDIVTDEGDVPDVEIELDGTENPDEDESISRIEPGEVTEDGRLLANATGGGLVREAIYDADTDTYRIDNLAFDGENVYQRDPSRPTLGGYGLYRADETVPDFLTSGAVGQIVPYNALADRSDVLVGEPGEELPRTSFAIVRTGGYGDFGFGGFVYERNGGVVLPTTGQAQWEGTYGGLRVFEPIGRIEYTEGTAYVAIDFDDFNINNGVQGAIEDRVGYDENGNLLPEIVEGDFLLPDIPFVIVQGIDTLLPTGEFSGDLRSTRINSEGQIEIYEDGKYYGIVAGDTTAGDGGEVVGVIVVESLDPRLDGISVQETGGFILDRIPSP